MWRVGGWCDLNLDWSGETGDFINFGSGGNHLCEDIPICIENSSFFNTRLEEQGYSIQIDSEQVCACSNDLYPDCAGFCSDEDNYGHFIDGCGLCTQPNDACILDCTGNWGGSKVFDCLSVCDGDAIIDCSGTCNGDSIIDCSGTCNGDSIIDCSDVCDGDASIDECGICEGDGTACTEVGYLYLDADELNNYYVRYETPESESWGISGFQFNVVGSSNFTQSGGIAEELDFGTYIADQLILGFSTICFIKLLYHIVNTPTTTHKSASNFYQTQFIVFFIFFCLL